MTAPPSPQARERPQAAHLWEHRGAGGRKRSSRNNDSRKGQRWPRRGSNAGRMQDSPAACPPVRLRHTEPPPSAKASSNTGRQQCRALSCPWAPGAGRARGFAAPAGTHGRWAVADEARARAVVHAACICISRAHKRAALWPAFQATRTPARQCAAPLLASPTQGTAAARTLMHLAMTLEAREMASVW